ncbi:hypothetical protein CYMTET_26217 [Cymbomonas tetramitiformis]|uniref:Uncharacterized protein n=1 Tax=Cymbomonas tetramitiformis TaxID=36881 RepID=A0AAE0FSY2_9CHLO|nr:hypothetical protein CYMTET_26217 [Cymbomonas tetramitiformis]
MDMTSNGDLPLLRLQEEPGMLLVRLMPGTFAAQLKTFNGPHSNGWGNNFSHVIRLQNVLPQLEDYWETVQDKHRFLRKLGKDSTDPFQATVKEVFARGGLDLEQYQMEDAVLLITECGAKAQGWHCDTDNIADVSVLSDVIRVDASH